MDMDTPLVHIYGQATVPGNQVFVWRYPEGTVSILFPTNVLTPTTLVLENPYTTDLVNGVYDFWTKGPAVKIVEIKHGVAPSPATDVPVNDSFSLSTAQRRRPRRLTYVVYNTPSDQ